MQDFRNIEAWKKAHGLVLNVYKDTLSMPKEEVFGVTMLLRRNATSIATGSRREVGEVPILSLQQTCVRLLRVATSWNI
jgi:hypothetical protein